MRWNDSSFVRCEKTFLNENSFAHNILKSVSCDSVGGKSHVKALVIKMYVCLKSEMGMVTVMKVEYEHLKPIETSFFIEALKLKWKRLLCTRMCIFFPSHLPFSPISRYFRYLLFIIYVYSVSAHHKTRTPAARYHRIKVFGARHGFVLNCDYKSTFRSIDISFDIINAHMSGSKIN